MSKASNLLAILWMLQAAARDAGASGTVGASGTGPAPVLTAAEIAERLELDVRTVYRYMDDLLTSGVPISAESGPAGGYRLLPGFRGAPLFFSPDELAALAHAARLASAVGHPDEGALGSAFRKVEQTLTAEQSATLERRREVLAVATERPGAPPLVGQLERAAAERVQLRLRYRKAEAETDRIVDPHALFHRGEHWYLVGYCHLRSALREFRLDRIRAYLPTGERFTPDPAFDLTAYLTESWVAERVASGPTQLVRLSGSEGVLEQLCRHWYLRYCLVDRSETEAQFRLDPIGLANLPGYLVIFGRWLQILAPAELRQAVAAQARKIAEHHE